jgi:hypothetical protein
MNALGLLSRRVIMANIHEGWLTYLMKLEFSDGIRQYIKFIICNNLLYKS